jgi:hypothetical protein
MTEPRPGVTMPIIVAGNQHRVGELRVYADGGFTCSSPLTHDEVRARIAAGELATSIPDGKQLSIYPFGAVTVRDGRWELGPAGLRSRIEQLVARPEETAWTRGRVDGWQPVRDDGAKGATVQVYVRDPDWHLVDLHVFADGIIEARGLSAIRTFNLAGVAAAWDADQLTTWASRGEPVIIRDLGRFVGEHRNLPRYAEILPPRDPRHDLLTYLADKIDALAGRPDSIDRCKAIYAEYLADPSDAVRARLRVAYETIPSMMRIFLGGHGEKDIDVKKAIYGNDFRYF